MSQAEYFKFVKALAIDLNRNEIKLTSFPDVVMRIRRVLDDPDMTGENLAKILSVDPVLASRVLVLANSTYHNPAGIKIEGLDAAIGRIGFEKVRTAAISYAVEQLYASKDLAPLKEELRQTWSAGLQLAAPIGESIVANWEFSDEIQATLNPEETATADCRVEANLADIVAAAKTSLNGDDIELSDTAEARRLPLTDEKMPAIMELYQQKLDSLVSAVR
jgi:HD-like signal output (HDOD) protein